MELKQYIEVLYWGSGKRVILLGHSKGGVDAAAALSVYWCNLKDKVAGLALGFDSADLKKSDESDAKKKEKEESSGIGKDTFAEVLMKDAKALGLIQGAVSDEIFPRISHEETSKCA
ncbi:hypothetical protein L3X38_031537 [Prunus dulcis]|uniref:Alpha/beta-Hydrolases superfamily protein n=1 Tax=Prunus dulcis TaxID=3755 RepID=A0AAD4YV07_PRUDU|nr:hypothetical protein L3X38_031537 [Prunus dulcis]